MERGHAEWHGLVNDVNHEMSGNELFWHGIMSGVNHEWHGTVTYHENSLYGTEL